MPRAIWKRILDGSVAEVLLAVDLYNRPKQDRRVEGFFVHMHLGWLYLLHAHLRRQGVDYRYRQPGSNRLMKVNGEPKTWELSACLKHHWPDPNNPVRKNIELTIALRNKIEHRFTEEALDVATSGYAQASLINYENEIATLFGEEWSLAQVLRFPVFIGTFTQSSAERMKAAKHTLPTPVRNVIDTLEADADDSVIEDSRYEFRVNLIRKTGPKTEADLSLNFVREDELTSEQKESLAGLGREGTVIVRERQRPVVSGGYLRPKAVVDAVAAAIPYVFNMGHFIRAWKQLAVRPPGDSDHPERTDENYCVYDEPHGDYVYKQAFVEKLVRKCQSEEGFTELTGVTPTPK